MKFMKAEVDVKVNVKGSWIPLLGPVIADYMERETVVNVYNHCPDIVEVTESGEIPNDVTKPIEVNITLTPKKKLEVYVNGQQARRGWFCR